MVGILWFHLEDGIKRYEVADFMNDGTAVKNENAAVRGYHSGLLYKQNA